MVIKGTIYTISNVTYIGSLFDENTQYDLHVAQAKRESRRDFGSMSKYHTVLIPYANLQSQTSHLHKDVSNAMQTRSTKITNSQDDTRCWMNPCTPFVAQTTQYDRILIYQPRPYLRVEYIKSLNICTLN